MILRCVLLGLVLAQVASADDTDDVNAAADRLRAAFNENSAEAAALFAVDGFQGFFDPVPLLNQGTEGLKQFLAGQFQFTEKVQMLPVGPRSTRVTGATATIAQNELFFWKPIDGAAESMFTNSLQVWTKVDGAWMLAGWMTSALPHGTAP